MAARVLYSANGCSGDWIDVAGEMQRIHGWEPCYWLTSPDNDPLVAESFPKAVRHAYLRAMRGLPPEGTGPVVMRPLDEPTLRSFRQCESWVLAMMGRMDAGGSFTYQDRIRHYHRLLSYWLGVVEAFHPDVAVFSTTPHEVADYVAYEACRGSGVRTLIFSDTRVPVTVAMRTSVEADLLNLDVSACHRGASSLHSAREQRSDDALDALMLDDSVADSTKLYLRGIVGDYDEALPDYMRSQIAGGVRRGLLRRAANALKVWRWGLYVANLTADFRRRGRVCGRDAYKIPGVPVERSWMTNAQVARVLEQGVRKKDALRAAYAGKVTQVGFECDYVYFPLHYQPERSTCPEGGDYNHQMLMVGLLHDLLPEGWYLYVREHPTQFLAEAHGEQGRDAIFYNDLVGYPRVRVVGMDVTPFELIDSARAVATVTGTAGWEGVVRGVPALVFGNAWYRRCEGAFMIQSAQDLREAYRALEEGFVVDRSLVGCFVAALERASQRADTDQADWGRSSEVTKSENVAALVALLEHAGADSGR